MGTSYQPNFQRYRPLHLSLKDLSNHTLTNLALNLEGKPPDPPYGTLTYLTLTLTLKLIPTITSYIFINLLY